jgi:hypothetical protein
MTSEIPIIADPHASTNQVSGCDALHPRFHGPAVGPATTELRDRGAGARAVGAVFAVARDVVTDRRGIAVDPIPHPVGTAKSQSGWRMREKLPIRLGGLRA